MVLRVSGQGIGAASAAQCLAARGIPVTIGGAPSARRAPVVLLGEVALALLGDVFAGFALPDGAHPIERRVVLWGTDMPRVFAHRGWVIAGNRLAQALPWPDSHDDASDHGPPALALTTTPPADARMMHFGAREAMALPVDLTPGADRAAALVEALAQGWLFLIPTGDTTGWLLVVGNDAELALRDSRLVAPAVAAIGAVSSCFETAPKLLDNPGGAGSLVLGSAALTLDPICGDGTATAVRGGILAAAVAAAMAGHDRGLDLAAVLAHYRAMTIATMRRHLTVSWPFYARGGDSAWWRDEAGALAEGHAWCTRQLAQAGEARFMLMGDRLVAREVAA